MPINLLSPVTIGKHYMDNALLSINELHVHFGPKKRPVRALRDVSLAINRGECVGLVGESGCGKSTLARTVLGLESAQSGTITFDGHTATRWSGRNLRKLRARIQMVFQDPFSSLNPRMKVGRMLDEVLRVHTALRSAERKHEIARLLQAVGLDPAFTSRFPHEFSGGQRQRVGIARALAVGPDLIIADEPVSALDVSVQVQILNLLKELQQNTDLAWLFIAHDLAVVRYICSRVCVMYMGRIVESAPVDELFQHPLHPYTQALIAAAPDIDGAFDDRSSRRRKAEKTRLKGEVPSPTDVIPGCPFHPRCPKAKALCRKKEPLIMTFDEYRWCRCHFAE